MKTWNASDYIPTGGAPYSATPSISRDIPVAIDIFDPGCIVCKQSYTAQKDSGFMDNYQDYDIPYAIPGDNGYRFRNSRLVSQYIEAIRGQYPEINEWTIIERLFTGNDEVRKLDYQSAFNGLYSAEEAEQVLLSWLTDAGLTEEQRDTIKNRAHSTEISQRLDSNKQLVEDTIKTKRIPTMLYDGRRHEGLFEK